MIVFRPVAAQQHKDSIAQRDLLDYVQLALGKKPDPPAEKDKSKKHFSIFPAVGYALATGFSAILTGNMTFYTDTSRESRMSFISSSFTYTQFKQILVPLQANIWLDGDKWNLFTNFRYIKFPSDIYGLGGGADPAEGYLVNFRGIRFHQFGQRKIVNNMYGGLGFMYDKFYDIEPDKSLPPSIAASARELMGNTEKASGVAARFLYDSRINPLNARQGAFVTATLRVNSKTLGSDGNFSTLMVDARKYVSWPRNSSNVIAFWGLAWLTTGGYPPFLLLPSTGWDDNYNSGRGYIQNRFRGKNMFYLETEYRYRITSNGLIGGVVFANVQKFSTDLSDEYGEFSPGAGIGLRIKLNKNSDTHVCIDYGFGTNGSRGLFVNLAEVF